MEKSVMRQRMRRFILPTATVLAVWVAAFLPQRLSALLDQRLLSELHTEAFNGSTDFSSSGLLECLRLLTAVDGSVETFEQEIVRSDRVLALSEQIHAEVLRLTEAEVLPEDILILLESAETVNVSLIYLRSQETLSSASMITLNINDNESGGRLELMLDEQSGKLLDLTYFSPSKPISGGLPMKEAGAVFLEGLALSGEYQGDSGGGGDFAWYAITGSDQAYLFMKIDHEFEIHGTAGGLAG